MSETIFDYISNFKNPIMWKHIIIHHSLTRDGLTVEWNAIRAYHKSLGWDDIGYHAGIELVGKAGAEPRYEFQIGRPLDMQGAHTIGQNDKAIGICIVGNFDIKEPEPVQYFLTASLCRAFQSRFGILTENINFHRDYSMKTCPGRRFDKNILRDYIAGITPAYPQRLTPAKT